MSPSGLGAKFGRGVTELGTLQLLYFAIFSESKVQYSAICVQRAYTNVLQACRRTREVSFSKERRHFNGTFFHKHTV